MIEGAVTLMVDDFGCFVPTIERKIVNQFAAVGTRRGRPAHRSPTDATSGSPVSPQMPYPARAGNDDVIGQAKEQPMADNTRARRQHPREAGRIGNRAERAIQDHVVLIGHARPGHPLRAAR